MHAEKNERGVFGRVVKAAGLDCLVPFTGQSPSAFKIGPGVIVIIITKENRMLELLIYVAYCGEFPVNLARRIPGHTEWNRHVMYRAIEEKYVRMYRGKYRQRIIKSLRIL